jgi:hypothetical protein
MKKKVTKSHIEGKDYFYYISSDFESITTKTEGSTKTKLEIS